MLFPGNNSNIKIQTFFRYSLLFFSSFFSVMYMSTAQAETCSDWSSLASDSSNHMEIRYKILSDYNYPSTRWAVVNNSGSAISSVAVGDKNYWFADGFEKAGSAESASASGNPAPGECATTFSDALTLTSDAHGDLSRLGMWVCQVHWKDSSGNVVYWAGNSCSNGSGSSLVSNSDGGSTGGDSGGDTGGGTTQPPQPPTNNDYLSVFVDQGYDSSGANVQSEPSALTAYGAVGGPVWMDKIPNYSGDTSSLYNPSVTLVKNGTDYEYMTVRFSDTKGWFSYHWYTQNYYDCNVKRCEYVLGQLGGYKKVVIKVSSAMDSLPAGIYNDTIVIRNATNGNGTTYYIPVTITIDANAARLEVTAPLENKMIVEQGGVSNSLTYNLKNLGTSDINYTVRTDYHTSSSDSAGVLTPGQNRQVTISPAESLHTNIYSTLPRTFIDNIHFTNDTNGAGSFEHSVAVEVVPLNQAPAVNDYIFQVSENPNANLFLGQVRAADPDEWPQALQYSILTDVSNNFSIDASSGGFYLISHSAMLASGQTSFDLVVEVSDGRLTATSNITVNVVSNTAPFLQAQSFDIPRYINNSNLIIGSVIANDNDRGPSALTYSIISDDTTNTFQIDANTGELSVVYAEQLSTLVNNSYTLLVRVEDGSLGNNSQMTINLTENQMPTLASETIMLLNGTGVVTDLQGYDADGNDLSYQIIEGNDAGIFTLLENQLSITDGETLPSVASLTIQVSDGLASSTAILDILTRFNPQVADHVFVFAKDSDFSEGAFVGKIIASDIDNPEDLSYSLYQTNSRFTSNDLTIDKFSGEISFQYDHTFTDLANLAVYNDVRVFDNSETVTARVIVAAIYPISWIEGAFNKVSPWAWSELAGGAFVGGFTAVREVDVQNNRFSIETYQLVTDPVHCPGPGYGSADNGLFKIIGDKLYTNGNIPYKTEYEICASVTDEIAGYNPIHAGQNTKHFKLSPTLIELSPFAGQAAGSPLIDHPRDIIDVADISLTPTLALLTGNAPFEHLSTMWEVSTDAEFNRRVYSLTSDSDLFSTILPSELLIEGVQYYWRAAFIDGQNSLSAWSETAFFTTAGSGPSSDGVYRDQQASIYYDLDNNGADDRVQPDISCLQNDNINLTVTCFKHAEGIEAIQMVRSYPFTLNSSDEGRPDSMDKGLFGFSLKTAVGATVQLRVYFKTPMDEGSKWYKYSARQGWVDYSHRAEFSADMTSVILTLTDGGEGDDDGIVNGVIVDPSGPAIVVDTTVSTGSGATTTSNSSGGGGGSLSWLLLLNMLLLGFVRAVYRRNY